MAMGLFKFKAGLAGQDKLKKWMSEFPEKVQNRIFRFAGRKAAALIASRAKALTPRSRDPRPKNAKPWHMADKQTYVQRVYRKSNTTVMVIGAESGTAPHSHLVEEGNPLTRPRMTKHSSRYVRVNQGVIRRRKLVTTKSGAVRTVWESVTKSKMKSIGSEYDPLKAGTLRNGRGRFARGDGGLARSTGNMPAFHPLGLAVREVQPNVERIIEAEVRAGLQRIASKS